MSFTLETLKFLVVYMTKSTDILISTSVEKKVYITEHPSLYVAGLDERKASRGYQYQCYKIATTGYAMLKLVFFFFSFFFFSSFFALLLHSSSEFLMDALCLRGPRQGR